MTGILRDHQPRDLQSLGGKDHVAVQSFLRSGGLPRVTRLGPQPCGPSHRLSVQRNIFERIVQQVASQKALRQLTATAESNVEKSSSYFVVDDFRNADGDSGS